MSRIRKVTAVVAAAATIAASFPSSPALAQARVIPTSTPSTAPVAPAALIPSTINAFPNGGEPLKLAITDLILAHPNLAPSLATYLQTEPLTPEQKDAIVAGLSDALNRLGIVAQDGGDSNPGLIALLILGGVGLGVGIWALTKNNDNATVKSPN